MLANRTRVPGTAQQALAGDIFSTYPANGFPALVNSGAVTKRGAFSGAVPGMLPRPTRGMGIIRRNGPSGLGDTVDLSGYYGSMGLQAPAGSIDSGGGGFFDYIGQTVTDLLPGLFKAGEQIATARYAVPPPGTLIKTPTSMIYTQPTAQQGAASSLISGDLFSGSSNLLPIVLIAAVALFAMKS